MPSDISASNISAWLQPKAVMKPCAIGENNTIPKDPADIASPMTIVRRAGSTTRTIAAMAIEKDVNERPAPTSTPPTS